MIQTIERLSNIHFEHLIWSNELQGMRAEIGIYLKRLDTLLAQYSATPLVDDLVPFKHSFEEVLRDVDDWQITIGAHEFHITELANLNGALTQMSNSEHEDIRSKMYKVRRSILELKESFQYFLINKMP